MFQTDQSLYQMRKKPESIHPDEKNYGQIKHLTSAKGKSSDNLVNLWRCLVLLTVVKNFHETCHPPRSMTVQDDLEKFLRHDCQVEVSIHDKKAGNYFSLWHHLEVIFILILMLLMMLLFLSFNEILHVQGHYISLEDYKGARHVNFIPPNIFRPCDHEFRDSCENCAIFSDIVIIGSAISFESSLPDNRYLYYANIRVRSVLKTPRFLIYPIRPNHVIKIGVFNYYQDKSRCMPNIQLDKDYFFFQYSPEWSGISRIAQLPQEYTDEKLFDIREVLYEKNQDLGITYVRPSEKLVVNENDNLKLECRAEGKPKPIISWLFGEDKIKRSFIQTTTDELESSINLLNLTLANQGNYTCLAENAFGSIQRSIQVTVIKKPVVLPVTTQPPHPCHNYCQNGSCYLDGGIPRCSCPNRYHGLQCEQVYQVHQRSQQNGRQLGDATKAIDHASLQGDIISTNNTDSFGRAHSDSPSGLFCKDCDSSFNKVFFLSILSFVTILLISLTVFLILHKKRIRLFSKRFGFDLSPHENIQVNRNQMNFKSNPREIISIYNSTINRGVNDPYFLTPQTYRHDVIANMQNKSLSCNLYNNKNGPSPVATTPEQFIYAIEDPLIGHRVKLSSDAIYQTYHPSPLLTYTPEISIPQN